MTDGSCFSPFMTHESKSKFDSDTVSSLSVFSSIYVISAVISDFFLQTRSALAFSSLLDPAMTTLASDGQLELGKQHGGNVGSVSDLESVSAHQSPLVDDTLPKSHQREVQRQFRARRATHLLGHYHYLLLARHCSPDPSSGFRSIYLTSTNRSGATSELIGARKHDP
jgi:hypothetical protein